MGQKLTQRTVLATTPDNLDLMHVVDVSDTTDSADGTSKKVTVGNLIPIDTDGTLAANSDTKIPSQKAVLTLVNNNSGDFLVSQIFS